LAADSIAAPDLAPMFAVVRAGERLVAAGRHGVIAYQDAAQPWRQASVPVSSDLVSLSFGSARKGWAVGHGGVVLHSADGGASWARQLDGKGAGELALAYYRKGAAGLDPAQREVLLAQAERWAAEGTTQPFLDVWFGNEDIGFIVGSFNRIFRTDDGGKRWTPLIDKIANPNQLHFYAVRGGAGETYIAGESGTVWRWDAPQGQFIMVPTPYNGSLFGLVVTPRAVLAFGMRGSLYRSLDRGAHWQKIPTGINGGLVAGDVRPNGEIVLASQSGELIASSDGGATFRPLADGRRSAVAAIAASPGGAHVSAGPAGVRIDGPASRIDGPASRIDGPASRIDGPASRIDGPASRIAASR
jgi:photosystem II stability/assembly factor-like uncharacterized protein